ncbi:MocR-like pyridoxine biosynthesis transcription factor PdxR [Dyella soli]|uniref:PLP-dependent aminotransferase family protein n=1 Tax=Dyella soli TaxID=522319 RepID=A0A4V2NKX6_9GAMM|nr:PLP-dependent aminotransferase family protein [Dyella soli]TCI06562.1 PLP-dependent aminotransferase family protein [Dyella soli]
MDQPLAFAIELPSRGRLEALHGQLRAAILDGRLAGGQGLPSTRGLAASLGLSRNTVVAAYDRLLSEGYVSARQGAGYLVSSGLARQEARVVRGADGDRRLAPPWRHAVMPVRTSAPASFRHDLRVGFPDASRFPFDVWRRLAARALRNLSRKAAGYPAPAGRRALREAIAGHVSFARAVTCGADDVVVCNGAQQAFDLLARILVTPGRTVVAVEDPGYPPLRAAFAAAGARVVPVPVDGEGLVVERLPATARVIYVTPSHQFPLGMVMSPARRMALLDFARRHGAVIIEDDYDGEFRYGDRPLDALQTLDRDGLVFYVGTFSKSLFPALRLGYAVAPPWALAALVQARQVCDWHADVLAQDTLASFIAEGHLARHVRKMRRIYAERREALIDGLVRHAGEWLALQGSDAGLHVAALLPPELDAGALVQRALAQDMRIEALSGYAIGATAPNGLVFGLGTLPAARMDEATQALGRLLRTPVPAQPSPRTQSR